MRVLVSAVYSRPKKRGEKMQLISQTYADVPMEAVAKLYAEQLAMRDPDNAGMYLGAYEAMRKDPKRARWDK